MNTDIPYMREKCLFALEAIVSAVKIIRDPGIPAGTYENMLSSLSCALWDLTKLMSCLSDAEWSTEDTQLILNGGDEGLDEVLAKYGFKKNTETIRYNRFITAKNILDSSKLERDTGRTLCHDALSLAPDESPFKELANLLEEVTWGRQQWHVFQLAAQRSLPDLVKNEGHKGK